MRLFRLCLAVAVSLSVASCSATSDGGSAGADTNYTPGGTDPPPAAPAAGGQGTHWTSAYPQFFDVVRGKDLYVAVGELGNIHTSPDGQTWTPRWTGVRWSLFGVTWNGEKYVAVGDEGAILTSSDGITWQSQAPITLSSRKFSAVAWNGKQFCAVGPGGLSAASTDGITWKANLIGGGVTVGPHYYDVTVMGDQFIAVGQNIALSKDCLTWSGSGHGFSGDTILTSVAWSAKLQRVVAGGHTQTAAVIYSSSDAAEWTPHILAGTEAVSGHEGSVQDIAWSEPLSKFVAVGNALYDRTALIGASVGNAGDMPTLAFTSPDGLAWTPGTAPSGGTGLSAVSCGASCVAVGEIGNVFASPDGSAWTAIRQLHTPGRYFVDVAWGNGQFVAVGGAGTIATSTDGWTWTPRESGTKVDLGRILWSGTQWITASSNRPGGFVLTSPDAITWTQHSTGDSQLGAITGLAWTGRHFVAADIDGFIGTSVDGIHWRYLSGGTAVNGAQDPAYLQLHWLGDELVALSSIEQGAIGGVGGTSSTLASTLDGTTWQTELTANGLVTDVVRTVAGFWILTSTSGDSAIRFGMKGYNTAPAGLSGGFVGQITFGLNALAYTGTRLVAVGTNPYAGRNDVPASIYTSDVGSTWQNSWSGTANSLGGIAWNGKVFVAVGGGGYPAIVTSD